MYILMQAGILSYTSYILKCQQAIVENKQNKNVKKIHIPIAGYSGNVV